jgi:peptidoglycan hydrolase FlgJ
VENLPISNQSPKVEGGTPAAPSRGKEIDREKLKRSCMDFEAIMISQLFKSMRQTVLTSDFMGEGLGKEIYQSLFDQEVSQSLAKGDGLGIGNMIYHQLIRQEEKSRPTPADKEGILTDPSGMKHLSEPNRGVWNGTVRR